MRLFKQPREKLFPKRQYCFWADTPKKGPSAPSSLTGQELINALSKKNKGAIDWQLLKKVVLQNSDLTSETYKKDWKEKKGQETRNLNFQIENILKTPKLTSTQKDKLQKTIENWVSARQKIIAATHVSHEKFKVELAADVPKGLISHIVQTGDTLTTIGKPHNIKARGLMQFNNDHNPEFQTKPIKRVTLSNGNPWYRIQEGQTIWIPTKEFTNQGGLVWMRANKAKTNASTSATARLKRITPTEIAAAPTHQKDAYSEFTEAASQRSLENKNIKTKSENLTEKFTQSIDNFTKSFSEHMNATTKTQRYVELIRQILQSQNHLQEIDKLKGLKIQHNEGIIGLLAKDGFRPKIQKILEAHAAGTLSEEELAHQMETVINDVLPKEEGMSKEILRLSWKSAIASAIGSATYMASTGFNPAIMIVGKIGELDFWGVRSGHYESMGEKNLQFLSEFLELGRQIHEINTKLEDDSDSIKLQTQKQTLQEKMDLLLQYGEKTRLENFQNILNSKNEQLNVIDESLDNLLLNHIHDPKTKKEFQTEIEKFNKMIKKDPDNAEAILIQTKHLEDQIAEQIQKITELENELALIDETSPEYLTKKDKLEIILPSELKTLETKKTNLNPLNALIQNQIAEINSQLEPYEKISPEEYHQKLQQYEDDLLLYEMDPDDIVEEPEPLNEHYYFLDTTLIEEHLRRASKYFEKDDEYSRTHALTFGAALDDNEISDNELTGFQKINQKLEESRAEIENQKPDQTIAELNTELEVRKEEMNDYLVGFIPKNWSDLARKNFWHGAGRWFTQLGGVLDADNEQALQIMKNRALPAYEKAERKIENKIVKFVRDEDHQATRFFLDLDGQSKLTAPHIPDNNPITKFLQSTNEIFGNHTHKYLENAYRLYLKDNFDPKKFPKKYRPLFQTALQTGYFEFLKNNFPNQTLKEIRENPENHEFFLENWEQSSAFIHVCLEKHYWSKGKAQSAKKDYEVYKHENAYHQSVRKVHERHQKYEESLFYYENINGLVGKILVEKEKAITEKQRQALISIAYDIEFFETLYLDLKDIDLDQLKKNEGFHPQTAEIIEKTTLEIETTQTIQADFSKHLLNLLGDQHLLPNDRRIQIQYLMEDYENTINPHIENIKTYREERTTLNQNPELIRQTHDQQNYETASSQNTNLLNELVDEGKITPDASAEKIFNHAEISDQQKTFLLCQKINENPKIQNLNTTAETFMFSPDILKTPEEAYDMTQLLKKVDLSSWKSFEKSLDKMKIDAEKIRHLTPATTSPLPMFKPDENPGGHLSKNLNLLMLLLPERPSEKDPAKMKPPIYQTIRTALNRVGLNPTNHELMAAISNAQYLKADQVKTKYESTQNIGVREKGGIMYYPGVDDPNEEFSPDGYEMTLNKEFPVPGGKTLTLAYHVLLRDVCFNINIPKQNFIEVNRTLSTIPISRPHEGPVKEQIFHGYVANTMPVYFGWPLWQRISSQKTIYPRKPNTSTDPRKTNPENDPLSILKKLF